MLKHKKISKDTLVLIVTLIGVTAIVMALILSAKLAKVQKDLSELTKAKGELETIVSDNKSLLQNEIYTQKSLLRPAVDAKENMMYIPEFKIAVPRTEVTKHVQYRVQDESDIRIISSIVLDTDPVRQLDCSEMVRLSLTSGTPYNPWEEYIDQVKLQDGRTMYILAAKAFKNNEASTEECATAVWQLINPRQIAEEFKNAQSY